MTRECMSRISLPQATGYCMVDKSARSSASMGTLCMEDWSCTVTPGHCSEARFSVLRGGLGPNALGTAEMMSTGLGG